MIGIYTGRKGELNFQADLAEKLQQAGWSDGILEYPTENELWLNFKKILEQLNPEYGALDDEEFRAVKSYMEPRMTTPIKANALLNEGKIEIVTRHERERVSEGTAIRLQIFNPLDVNAGPTVYQIAKEPLFRGETGNVPDGRGDLSLLINGMPLIHIELKTIEKGIEAGLSQIASYWNRQEFVGLYGMVQVFFIMTPEDAVYFANGNFVEISDKLEDKRIYAVDRSKIFRWGRKGGKPQEVVEGKDSYGRLRCGIAVDPHANTPIYDWQELVTGADAILSVPTAHELAAYYVTAEVEKDKDNKPIYKGNSQLYVARSYQKYAADAIFEVVRRHDWTSRNQLGGYVWGTTGCGKTLTSFKTGQRIIDNNNADRVIFLIDRVELGEQSFKKYRRFSREGQKVTETENQRKLLENLTEINTQDNRLVVTSIQKLSAICKGENISGKDKIRLQKAASKKRLVFIVDEAHRSQFGEMHHAIKKFFPKALFFGFTGTPIFKINGKKDHEGNFAMSSDKFGEPLAAYTILDGIRDGNVLGFDRVKPKMYEDTRVRKALARYLCNSIVRPDEKQYPQSAETWDWCIDSSTSMLEIEAKITEEKLDLYENDEYRRGVVQHIKEGLPDWCMNRFYSELLTVKSIPDAILYYRLFKEIAPELRVTAVFDPNLGTQEHNEKTDLKMLGLHEIITDYNSLFGTNYQAFGANENNNWSAFKSDVMNRLCHETYDKNGEPPSHEKETTLDLVIVVHQLLTGFDCKYIKVLCMDCMIELDGLVQAMSRTNRTVPSSWIKKEFGFIRCYRKPHTMAQNIYDALELYCAGSADKVIVPDIEENLVKANQLYDRICDIFANAGINGFENVPENEADRKEFRKAFSELNDTLDSMKQQGMRWGNPDDEYVQQLTVRTEKFNGNSAYDLLKGRYKDCTQRNGSTERITEGFINFGVPVNASDEYVDPITAEFLEAEFRKLMPILEREGSKSAELESFRTQLNVLSEEDRRYGEEVLEKISNGKISTQGITFLALIREAKAQDKEKARDKRLLEFAEEYGVGYRELRQAYLAHYDIPRISREVMTNINKEKLKEATGFAELSKAKAVLVKKIQELFGGLAEK